MGGHPHAADVATHPFYQALNRALKAEGFDAFVEARCAPFDAATVGRPSLLPGRYFRLLQLGYFEGQDSARGMAWRTVDSLSLRAFLGLGLEEWRWRPNRLVLIARLTPGNA